MGAGGSKLPKHAAVHWQRLEESVWVPLGRASSEQVERGFLRCKQESVCILDELSECPGDQVLFYGDLSTRLGGPLIYRHKRTLAVYPLRRVLVRYVFTPRDSQLQPSVAILKDCDTPGKPTYKPAFDLPLAGDGDSTTPVVTKSASASAGAVERKGDDGLSSFLTAETVSAILTAQYGSPDVQPLGPSDPPVTFVDIVDSMGRRWNLVSTGSNVDELVATDANNPSSGPIGKFVRHEVVLDSTYLAPSQ